MVALLRAIPSAAALWAERDGATLDLVAANAVPLSSAPDADVDAAWRARVALPGTAEAIRRCRVEERGQRVHTLRAGPLDLSFVPPHFVVAVDAGLADHGQHAARAAAETALADSESQFRALVEGAGIGIALVELDGSLRLGNPALCAFLGRDEATLRATPIADVTHPDDLAADFAEFQELLAGKRTRYQMEKRYLRPDGSPVWGRLTVTVIPGADGTPRFGAAMVEDINEWKRAEAARHESETRYHALFDRHPLPLLLVDETSHAILGANAAALAAYGYSSDEMRELTAHDLRPSEDVPLFLDRFARLGEESVGGHIFRHRRKDGGDFLVEIATRRVHVDGRAARLCAVTDVTERERVADELRQARKMEAVHRVAGGIAHDFNNVLTVIEANAELLLPNAADAAREGLSEILDAASRGSALTRQLLAFSRRQPVVLRRQDVDGVVRQMERMLRRLLGQGVVLVTDLRAGGTVVLADQSQLEQVVLNLAINARDAMPDGGCLTVATEVRVAAAGKEPAPARVVLRVTDTGRGMSEETRSRVFEPFFTTKADRGGTGFGLATVYGIVKQLGGDVHVASAPGRGAEFTVTLPEAPADRSPR